MKKVIVCALVALLAFVGLFASSEALAAAGDVTPANASYLVLPTSAQAVTNGQAVTLSNSHTLLSNAGASATTTNTLVAPTVDGLMAVIAVASGQTNASLIKSSASTVIGSDVTLSADGAPLIVVSSSAKWYRIGGAGSSVAQKFLSATGVTNTLNVVNGAITTVE
jgi:hypothetical protein